MISLTFPPQAVKRYYICENETEILLNTLLTVTESTRANPIPSVALESVLSEASRINLFVCLIRFNACSYICMCELNKRKKINVFKFS